MTRTDKDGDGETILEFSVALIRQLHRQRFRPKAEKVRGRAAQLIRSAPSSVRGILPSAIENNRGSEDAQWMSYPDETMRLARGLTEEIVRLASELLQAGADLAYVQTVYTIPAIETLSEAEALGVQATSGDQDAGAALNETLSKLTALRDRAHKESDQRPPDG